MEDVHCEPVVGLAVALTKQKLANVKNQTNNY